MTNWIIWTRCTDQKLSSVSNVATVQQQNLACWDMPEHMHLINLSVLHVKSNWPQKMHFASIPCFTLWRKSGNVKNVTKSMHCVWLLKYTSIDIIVWDINVQSVRMFLMHPLKRQDTFGNVPKGASLLDLPESYAGITRDGLRWNSWSHLAWVLKGRSLLSWFRCECNNMSYYSTEVSKMWVHSGIPCFAILSPCGLLFEDTYLWYIVGNISIRTIMTCISFKKFYVWMDMSVRTCCSRSYHLSEIC